MCEKSSQVYASYSIDVKTTEISCVHYTTYIIYKQLKLILENDCI